MSVDKRTIAAAAGLTCLLGLTAGTSLVLPASTPDDGSADVTGIVLDTEGKPVAGATVQALRSDGTEKAGAGSDAAGRFSLPDNYPVLLRVEAAGYAGRTVAAAPGYPVAPVLAKATADSVSVRFGGDVMFGRRFYEKNAYGKTLLKTVGSVEEHRNVLSGIAPLLADGDISAVNLETALVPNDVLERSFDNRDGLHPTKDFVIVSSSAAAQALKDTGVDVVSLGNNHSYDALDGGIQTTVDALDAAGVAHFGAGMTPEEAWQPAIVPAKNGQRVAFIGCTTVEGDQHAISYVAAEGKGGAALCDPDRLTAAIAQAKATTPTVIVMIHGGVEYQREQTPDVLNLTTVAVNAGATSVINHHPHVAGKVRDENGAFVAESLGNLVFDQPLWETLPSYLARIDVAGGRVVRGSVDPIVINGYTPRPAVGDLADSIARIAVGGPGVPGSIRLPSPSPIPAPGRPHPETVVAGDVRRIKPGEWITDSGTAGVGRDLLMGTGSFARVSVGESSGTPALWKLGEHVQISDQAQCGPSDGTPGRGIVFARGGLSEEDAVATPTARMKVSEGAHVTLLLDISTASNGATAEIGWYDAMAGASTGTTTIDIPRRDADAECQTISLDAVVPKGTIAAQPIIKLTPPSGNTATAHLAVDNVRFIEWVSGDTGKLADTVGTHNGAAVEISADGPA